MPIKDWKIDGDAKYVDYSAVPDTKVYHPEATAGYSVVSRIVNEGQEDEYITFTTKGLWAGNAKEIISTLRLYEKDHGDGPYLEDTRLDFEKRFGDVNGWVLGKWQIHKLVETEIINGKAFPLFKDTLFWYHKSTFEGSLNDILNATDNDAAINRLQPEKTTWIWVGLQRIFIKPSHRDPD